MTLILIRKRAHLKLHNSFIHKHSQSQRHTYTDAWRKKKNKTRTKRMMEGKKKYGRQRMKKNFFCSFIGNVWGCRSCRFLKLKMLLHYRPLKFRKKNFFNPTNSIRRIENIFLRINSAKIWIYELATLKESNRFRNEGTFLWGFGCGRESMSGKNKKINKIYFRVRNSKVA